MGDSWCFLTWTALSRNLLLWRIKHTFGSRYTFKTNVLTYIEIKYAGCLRLIGHRLMVMFFWVGLSRSIPSTAHAPSLQSHPLTTRGRASHKTPRDRRISFKVPLFPLLHCCIAVAFTWELLTFSVTVCYANSFASKIINYIYTKFKVMALYFLLSAALVPLIVPAVIWYSLRRVAWVCSETLGITS